MLIKYSTHSYFMSTEKLSRRTYSSEITNLFITHRNEGKTLTWISNALQISFHTIARWNICLKRWIPLWDQRSHNGREKTFSDTALVEYIEAHENATLKEIGVHFMVSDMAIFKRLRILKYSYKKKKWATGKETKKHEGYFNKHERVFPKKKLSTLMKVA